MRINFLRASESPYQELALFSIILIALLILFIFLVTVQPVLSNASTNVQRSEPSVDSEVSNHTLNNNDNALCRKLSINNTKVSASGNELGNPPSNTIDNNFTTRWSNPGNGSWIEFDLGSTKSICTVDIAWYKGDQRKNNFVISMSNDGTNFEDIFPAKSSGTTLSFEKAHLINASARYVRVTVNGNTENSWASITELEITGKNQISKAGLGDNALIDEKESNNNNHTSKSIRISDNKLDAFRIEEIYPTKSNGTEWYSKWDNRKLRVLQFGERDPYDPQFILRGEADGMVKIDGNGTATVLGSAPRLFVYDDAKQKKFENLEITFYGKRISEITNPTWQGLIAGGRSEHIDNFPCNGRTYYGRMTYDGRMTFEKELFHGVGDDAFYPVEPDPAPQPWNTPDNILPKNKWIGFKFIIRSIENGTAVNLELFRDMGDSGTSGSNRTIKGGDWHKVLEYTDDGNWSVVKPQSALPPQCRATPANKILFDPGFVFIRSDEVQQVQYKKFSIREIDPAK